MITSLPILFENLVVEVLLTLKEVVIETHLRETEVNSQQDMYSPYVTPLISSW